MSAKIKLLIVDDEPATRTLLSQIFGQMGHNVRTAKDGFSAARIEEEVVVTDKGCQVITLFPAEELPIANRY